MARKKDGRPLGVFSSKNPFTPDNCPCGTHPFNHRCKLCGYQRNPNYIRSKEQGAEEEAA